jgi:hypothetical protein
MQLLVLLQAPSGCARCLLNRRQGGHSRSERCGVQKSLLPLPGIKPWTVTRVAAVDATTTLLDISIKPSGGVRTRKRWGDREQGRHSGSRPQLKVLCDTPAYQPPGLQKMAARLSSVNAAGHPDLSASPARRMIVPTDLQRASCYYTPAFPWREA